MAPLRISLVSRKGKKLFWKLLAQSQVPQPVLADAEPVGHLVEDRPGHLSL